VIAVVAVLLVGGAVGATVRALGTPEMTIAVPSPRDGSRAQSKIIELAHPPRRPETVVLTEAEVNGLLARHLVEARGIRLSSPRARLLGDGRLVLFALSPARHLLDELSLAVMADLLPEAWQTRPVWLRIGARVRVEGGPHRRLRIDVDEFAIGRQRVPAKVLRLLVDPATVGLLQWPLPDHVGHVGIEPGRVVIQTEPPR
jgi:hypothetical protein